MKPIAIGCDPNAIEMKNEIKKLLDENGFEYKDFGSDDPIYANVAIEVSQEVASGKFSRGILICGTGIGVSIAANKVKGSYAALCSNVYAAERAQLSNNANILALGAFTTGIEVAKAIVLAYLKANYITGTRSEEKVNKILEYERTNFSN